MWHEESEGVVDFDISRQRVRNTSSYPWPVILLEELIRLSGQLRIATEFSPPFLLTQKHVNNPFLIEVPIEVVLHLSKIARYQDLLASSSRVEHGLKPNQTWKLLHGDHENDI